MKLRISMLVIATLLIAAHFLRDASFIPIFISLAAPFLLFVKKRWSLVTVQAWTVFAAIIWMFTLYGIIQERILEGRSWTVSAIILGTVAAYTFLTAWLLGSPVMKEEYP